eukprot:GHVO01035775.1.p1 GENE.GHVO01035775.1~~GHVO01035775.1.p1  ORF type:complete len:285 (-),score=42.06 GHVO01035775.1:10-864(-)
MTAVAKVAEGFQSTSALGDGVLMPLFGFGCYLLKKEETTDAVLHALKTGHRLVDTAEMYENEEEVGEAVKKSGIPREQIFIATKVWKKSFGRDTCIRSVQESLKKLSVHYVDLVLMHCPCTEGKNVETYQALMECKEKGLIRSVGVSNFGVAHLEGLKSAGCPTPSVNQIELNVFYRQKSIVDYCTENNIAVMGYSPLTRAIKGFDNETLKAMATKHKKSVPQVMIRWSVQKGFSTIPKSAKLQRIEENANVFDFSLDDEEMTAIEGLPESPCGWAPQNDPWMG